MPHDNFENEITDESIVVVALKAGSNTIVIEGDKPLYIEPESDIFRTVAKLDPTLPYERPVTTTTTAETTTTAPPTTTTTTTTTTPAQTLYYAVNAKTYDGWEESSNTGFKGKSYFNYNNSIGGFVDWTVTVPEDGNYAVTFRYANGTNSERTFCRQRSSRKLETSRHRQRQHHIQSLEDHKNRRANNARNFHNAAGIMLL